MRVPFEIEFRSYPSTPIFLPRGSQGYPRIHSTHHVPAPLTPRGNPRVTSQEHQHVDHSTVSPRVRLHGVQPHGDHAGVGISPGSRTPTTRGFGVAKDIRVTTAGLPWYTLKSLAYPQYNTGFPGGSGRLLPTVARGERRGYLGLILGFTQDSARSPPAIPVAYRRLTPLHHHRGAKTPRRGGYMSNPSSPLA